MEYKHYIVIVIDKNNKFYGLDLVNPNHQTIAEVLTKLKNAKVSFSKRVIFTNSASFNSVLNSGQCLYYQIEPVKTVEELLLHAV